MKEIFKTKSSSFLLHGNAAPSQAAAGRDRLLKEWNDTAVDHPRGGCIHDLFEMQAGKSPEAVALIFENQRLTYGELDERADQLARHLRELGVGPETLVGLFAERSLEMVVGLLGILKAGGAYVPMDPKYPQERLAFMLQDARPLVILTQQRLQGHLPAHQSRVVCLDALAGDISCSGSQSAAAVRPQAGNLAYVIYTSGSTGTPKGVAIEHRNTVNFIYWAKEVFSDPEMAGVLAATSICFDLSVFELFVTLSRGGKVILADHALQLPQLPARDEITLVNTVPSAMAELVKAGGVPSSVQVVNLAGEPLTTPLVDQIYALNHVKKVNDLYGPTETTTYSTFTLRQRGAKPTIGRPIANTQIYLLNQERQLVPVGEAGELHIGGMGLARGYLNRPELTAEKFIANPFSQEPGARLYKTGDLARHLPDGNLEFLGRIDQQVKIRGFRIELGEIEAVLGTHPNILNTVVVAREDVPGEKTLAAYLVVRQEPAPKLTELRDFLLKKLPDYMVPAAFVKLDKLPLTPNGKIDRKALPAPAENLLHDGVPFVAPTTPTELALARIWAELLNLKQTGIHDNFFALGGHSLLAVKMIFRIQNELKVELPMKSIAEFPTIAELSCAVDKAPVISETEVPLRQIHVNQSATSKSISFGQEQLWFIDLLEPGSSAYNIPLAIRLKGHLDQVILLKSLNQLIHRHETLRTTFQNQDGVPFQVVASELTIKLKIVNLENILEPQREKEAQRLLMESSIKPFNLNDGPLIWAELFKLNEEDHILLLNVHHIVFDGWSVNILLQDLTAYYSAFCEGRNAELPELPISYGDFAAWQRRYLTAEKIEQHLGYWREQLADVPTVLELPSDRPRKTVSRNRGFQQYFKLSSEMAGTLRKLSQKNESTIFAALLASFHALLHSYSKNQQILIGVPFAGRTSREVENLVGFFVNSLPVKADFSKNPSFLELLRQVQDAIWMVQTHQDLPFERLVRELQPTRKANCNPLFQVCVSLDVMSSETYPMQGLTIEHKILPSSEAMFDLTLTLMDKGNQIDGVLYYNADLFDDTTIIRLLNNYQTLLAGILANPKQRMFGLPVMTDAEQHQTGENGADHPHNRNVLASPRQTMTDSPSQAAAGRDRLLKEWNDTAVDHPRGGCIHDLFEMQAGKSPEAVALIFENQRLTYGELDERADQLARHLRELGVGPETLVGLFAERSLEMVVGLLGILKAGGAYVPMDPKYPQERLAFMLQDARPLVILTQQRLQGHLPAHQSRVVCLDALAGDISCSGSQSAAAVRPQAGNLAYVIYTSGSTGTPKGVAIEHRNTVNFIYWAKEVFSDPEMAGVLAATSICFDLSVFELFVTLSRGGKVILADHALQLPQLPARDEITLVNTVPSAMAELVKAGGVPSSVQVVNLAGEPLTTPLVDQIYALNHVKKVNDLYGPTETTTYSTFTLRQRGAKPTIGRPIANTQIYLLNQERQLVPVGEAGELHIGGMGLARGYLNRPELTAEKFIANPFSQEPGARLYKTGDLARHLPDGNLEFLGRIDQQVKIRGFRIELGEIEAVLGTHPNILNTVVVAREDVPGEKTLAAYLVVRQEPAPKLTELRDFLLKKLPDYMVPAAFVKLDKLPLTPNGKIDRKALPAPAENLLHDGVPFVAPTTPTELALARIWAELLNLKQTSIHDNFFALGGHSLLAVKMISEIKRQMKFEMPIRTIFQHPTIQELAHILPNQKIKGHKAELIQLNSNNSGPEIYFLIDEGSLGLFKLAYFLDGGWRLYASVATLSKATLKASEEKQFSDLPSMKDLAVDHVARIRNSHKTGPLFLAGHCFGGMLAFEVAQQLHDAGIKVEAVLLLDTWMKSPPTWWQKKAWLQEHLGKLIQHGLPYLWSKSWRRINLEKSGLLSRLGLSIRDDFDIQVPLPIIARIYRHAIDSYQSKTLPSRGILFVSQDDWLSNAYRKVDDSLGAKGLFKNGVEVKNVPGNHLTIMDEANLPELASHFKTSLEKLL